MTSSFERWLNGVLIERTVTQDNGDGTGTRTTYDPQGSVTATEALTGLPIPEPTPLSPEERIAALEADLAAALELLNGGQ